MRDSGGIEEIRGRYAWMRPGTYETMITPMDSIPFIVIGKLVVTAGDGGSQSRSKSPSSKSRSEPMRCNRMQSKNRRIQGGHDARSCKSLLIQREGAARTIGRKTPLAETRPEGAQMQPTTP